MRMKLKVLKNSKDKFWTRNQRIFRVHIFMDKEEEKIMWVNKEEKEGRRAIIIDTYLN